MVLVMVLLELPGRAIMTHTLGLFAKEKELRFSDVKKLTEYLDPEVDRALKYLKLNHFIRAKSTKLPDMNRTVLVYSITARGRAAWEAIEIYGRAIEEREDVLGRQEVQEVREVLQV
jgi:predicted transcriptional regulator